MFLPHLPRRFCLKTWLAKPCGCCSVYTASISGRQNKCSQTHWMLRRVIQYAAVEGSLVAMQNQQLRKHGILHGDTDFIQMNKYKLKINTKCHIPFVGGGVFHCVVSWLPWNLLCSRAGYLQIWNDPPASASWLLGLCDIPLLLHIPSGRGCNIYWICTRCRARVPLKYWTDDMYLLNRWRPKSKAHYSHFLFTEIIKTKIIKTGNKVEKCLISVVPHFVSIFPSPIFTQNMKRYK